MINKGIEAQGEWILLSFKFEMYVQMQEWTPKNNMNVTEEEKKKREKSPGSPHTNSKQSHPSDQ